MRKAIFFNKKIPPELTEWYNYCGTTYMDQIKLKKDGTPKSKPGPAFKGENKRTKRIQLSLEPAKYDLISNHKKLTDFLYNQVDIFISSIN